MTPAQRLAMLERKIDALLTYIIVPDPNTYQIANRLSGMAGGPTVSDEAAAALDILAVEGGQMIARKAVKKRRKASAYARRYGAAYKRLKKKHPRAQHRTLVKKAHAEARKGKK